MSKISLLVSLILILGYPILDARPQEVRGVWITNVDSDMLFSHARLVEGIDRLARTGFNVVYPVVWNKGMTLYPSRIMDSLFNLPQDTLLARQKRDPLAELIVEAHRRGMEVIPWFEFGFAASYQQNGGHILARKPEWAAIDSHGRLLTKNGFEWMDALNPEVQAFMLALVMEVVYRYDIDGIQGDDRLPAMPVEGGYSPSNRELYRREHTGQNPPADPRDYRFMRWKASHLNKFARRMYHSVKAADNHLVVSLAPNIYSWGYLEYLQDSKTWLDSLYCDQYIPQTYRWNIRDYKELALNIYGESESDGSGFLNAYWKNRSVPGIILKSGDRYNRQDYVLEAVRFNRLLGIQGEIFFFYEGLGDRNNHLADTLYHYVYHEPARLPYRHDHRWRPPALMVQVEDPGTEKQGEWSIQPGLIGFDASTVLVCQNGPARLSLPLSIPDSGLYDVFFHIAAGSPPASYPSLSSIRIDSLPAGLVCSDSTWGWIPIGSRSFDEGPHHLSITIPDSIQAPALVDALMLMVNRRHSRQPAIRP
ncbi:MAG: family 10 glycosylhydrolase [Candidatus Delongbacteria bacterium]|nr:family 10 glycosylhydrolase [Candidatus Delongbacteria bacterium]